MKSFYHDGMDNAGEEQPSSSTGSSSTRSLTAKELKKARHIRSEKKRRNEIRLGFERLSRAVPQIAQRLQQSQTKRGRGRLPLQGVSEHRLEDGDGDGEAEASESRQEEMIRNGAVSELEILTSSEYRISVMKIPANLTSQPLPISINNLKSEINFYRDST